MCPPQWCQRFNGWFCPYHGSHCDVSGHIQKGPAPPNLEVPSYKFTGDKKILIICIGGLKSWMAINVEEGVAQTFCTM
eukprot:15365079-Ditylum_brightwellii.AAC.1